VCAPPQGAEETSVNAEDLGQLITMAAAQQRLRVSRTHLRRHVLAGNLKPVNTPYGRLLRPEEVERLVEERKRRGRLPA
jgi:predicted site-specific integrase-resolvase